MTSSTKDHPIIKVLKGFFPYFATPAMLVTIIYGATAFKTDIESRAFDTPEQKANVVNKIENLGNEVDNYILKTKLDSSFTALQEYRIQQEKRDLETKRKSDSLETLRIVTEFQNKQIQSQILQELKTLKEANQSENN